MVGIAPLTQLSLHGNPLATTSADEYRINVCSRLKQLTLLDDLPVTAIDRYSTNGCIPLLSIHFTHSLFLCGSGEEKALVRPPSRSGATSRPTSAAGARPGTASRSHHKAPADVSIHFPTLWIGDDIISMIIAMLAMLYSHHG
jgi:hypothetical protein